MQVGSSKRDAFGEIFDISKANRPWRKLSATSSPSRLKDAALMAGDSCKVSSVPVVPWSQHVGQIAGSCCSGMDQFHDAHPWWWHAGWKFNLQLDLKGQCRWGIPEGGKPLLFSFQTVYLSSFTARNYLARRSLCSWRSIRRWFVE